MHSQTTSKRPRRQLLAQRLRADLRRYDGDIIAEAFDHWAAGSEIRERMDAWLDRVSEYNRNPTPANARAVERARHSLAYRWTFTAFCDVVGRTLWAELEAERAGRATFAGAA